MQAVTFGVYLLVCLAIGYYSSKTIKIQTFMNDYFVAGRTMTAWVMGLVAMSTLASGGVLVGTPSLAWGFGYVGGLWQTMAISYSIVICGVLGKRVAELSSRVNAISFSDLMRERYNDLVGVLSTIIILIVLFLFVGAQYIASARVFEMAVGVDYRIGILIFGAIMMIYLGFGGTRAQMLTNVLQALLMLFAAVVGGVAVLRAVGGFGPIAQSLFQQNPAFLIPPGPNNWLPIPFYLSFGILLPIFGGMGQPHVATRFFALGSKQNYKITMLVGGIITVLWFVPLIFLGLGARVLFPELANPDFTFPTVAMTLFHPLIGGLLLAGIVSSMMSSVDAMLITCSATFTKDIYQRKYPQASSQKLKIAGIASIVVLTIGSMVIALYPPQFVLFIVLAAFGMFGVTFGPALIAGMFWKRANAQGAFASILAGFVVTSALFYPAIRHPLGFHAVGWGAIFSVVTLIIVTILTPPSSVSILKKFFAPRETQYVSGPEPVKSSLTM